MYDRTFQPAGAAMAAIVASLAPGAHVSQPVKVEADARETLIAQAAKFKPAAPFGADVDMPATKGAQLALFTE
jgi:hypothetical protein